MLLFVVGFMLWSIIQNKNTIPTLAVCFNAFLLSSMEKENWIRFIVWLLIGLVIYFFYGKNKKTNPSY
jgi:APA family basic amino acid/polyamine antiporter